MSAATMSSPAPGSVLAGSSATFTWTNDGSQQYWIYVGSTYGAYDFASINCGRNTAVTVSSLPTDGRTIYVRLWYLYYSWWYYADYSYRAASGGGTVVKAEIRTPAPGTTLTNSSATFSWNNVGASSYYLFVGRSLGASDIAALPASSYTTSLTVSGIPVDGSRVYARLWTLTPSGWLYAEASYSTQASGQPATIYYPTPGTTLTGSSATFAWSGGTSASGYCLAVGSSAGGSDLYNRCLGLVTSTTVADLPLDSRRLYVRLTTQFTNGSSQYRDATYVASQQGTTFRLSVFPLPNLTYSTARINSVFDHSSTTPYCPDYRVVAYNGEEGSSTYGSSAVGNVNGCGTVSGFRNRSGTAFSVNGQYSGAGTPAYLFYDGHPGYDYRTVDLCPAGRVSDICPLGTAGRVIVRAAASGKVTALVSSYGRIQIAHSGGYETWYMHLQTFKVTVGQQVNAGDVIGIAGETGAPGSPHLHFEVRHNGIPVDPYGWSGAGADPYKMDVNYRLW